MNQTSNREVDWRACCCAQLLTVALRLVLLILLVLAAAFTLAGCSETGSSDGTVAAATVAGAEEGEGAKEGLAPPANDGAEATNAESGAPSDGVSQPSSAGEGSSGGVVVDETAAEDSGAPESPTSSMDSSAGASPLSAPPPTPSVAPTGQNSVQAEVVGVEGMVVDMDTGEPLAGARVSFGDEEVTSRSDGSFVLLVSVRTGDVITANKEGYIGARRRIDMGPGDGYATCRLELLSLDSENAPPPAPAG